MTIYIVKRTDNRSKFIREINVKAFRCLERAKAFAEEHQQPRKSYLDFSTDTWSIDEVSYDDSVDESIVEDKLHSNRPQTYLVVACGPELEKMTDEHRNLLDELNIELIESGVGGYNAADTVQDLCTDGQANWIINVGTAGSHVHPVGSIVCPTMFGRRDVDATLIMREFDENFSEYMIPFENEMFVGPWQDRFNTLAGWASHADRMDFSGFIEGGICWTGDNTHGHLETTDAKEKAGKNPSSNFPKFEVVEMEAWWMAKKCQKHRIPFTAFKWISDGADDDVGEEWAKNADGIPWDDILLKIKNAIEWNYSNSV